MWANMPNYVQKELRHEFMFPAASCAMRPVSSGIGTGGERNFAVLPLPELICSGVKEENDWRLWSLPSTVQDLLHTFLYTEVDHSIHSIHLAFLGFTFINHSELREGHLTYFEVLRQRMPKYAATDICHVPMVIKGISGV